MPLVQWIMQNLQQTFPSIFVGGSSVVTIEYNIVMSNGVKINGIAKNILTQKSCKFVICKKGFFCKSKTDCKCYKSKKIPPKNAVFSRERRFQKFGKLNAVLPSIVQCGRPHVRKILKNYYATISNVIFFSDHEDFIFITA